MAVRYCIWCLAGVAYVIVIGLSGCSSFSGDSVRTQSPCASVVTVQPGDTLSEIALRCRVDMKRLAQANGLEAPYLIWVGQRLKLPGRQQTAAPRKAYQPPPPQLIKPVGTTPRVMGQALFFATEIETPVKVAAAGQVVAVEQLPFYGQVVLVAHTQRYMSVYGFLWRVHVQPGQRLAQGTLLGLSGVNPETGEPGVYFELRLDQHPYPLKQLFLAG